ncbi:unnamed protein product [Symbiodinium necroappetens]|uniref:Uncharacterized protein n=1 Tax=Symbiodinium necroappetens TaxID=1628268 RepID=A0A812WCN4_9DINO|nr:unnamed protein product [Symbiodinium necroappetens]
MASLLLTRSVMTKTLMISMAARPGAKLKLAITVRVSPRYVPLDAGTEGE